MFAPDLATVKRVTTRTVQLGKRLIRGPANPFDRGKIRRYIRCEIEAMRYCVRPTTAALADKVRRR